MLFNFDESKWFLNSIYQRTQMGYIEFRLLKQNCTAIQNYIDIRAIARAGTDKFYKSLAECNEDGWNVYYGVAIRNGIYQPAAVPALWIDVDFKDIKMENGLIPYKDKIQMKLLSNICTPSIIVKSGHGLHAYWILSEPSTDHDLVARLNKQLAKFYNGDRVHDVARIMRLPGFYNVKDREAPQLCQVSDAPTMGITNTVRIYDIKDLAQGVNILQPLPQLDEKLQRLIETGNDGQFKSRSEADFVVISGLLKKGCNEDEIIDIFENEKIGDKYRDKGKYAIDYIRATIQAAQERME